MRKTLLTAALFCLAAPSLWAQSTQFPELPALTGKEKIPLSYVAPPANLPVFTDPDQISAYVTKSGGAGMATSAANAILPDALKNLSLLNSDATYYTFSASSSGVEVIKSGHVAHYLYTDILGDGSNLAGIYSYNYTGGIGPPYALGYRGACSSGNPGTEAGHYAYRALDASSQENTIAGVYGYVLDCTASSMDSQLRLGWMGNVNTGAGNAQPNHFITIDDTSGVVFPGINLGGIASLTANTSAVIGTESTEGEAALSRPLTVNLQTSGQDNILLTNGGAGGLNSSIQFRGSPSNFGSNYSTGHVFSGRSGNLAGGYATSFLTFGSASANNTYNDEITLSNGTTTFGGQMVNSHLTTGTNADFVCLKADGTFLVQTSACTISSLRFKNVIGDVAASDSLERINRLQPIAYTMRPNETPNADWNFDKPQVGLAAEDVAENMPKCAIYEQDGKTPKSYRQECVIAELVGAIKAQQREIGALKAAQR